VQEIRTPRQTTLLVRLSGAALDPVWVSDDVSLEDLVLAYMSRDEARPSDRVPLSTVAGPR
jgi:hypothetical protein